MSDGSLLGKIFKPFVAAFNWLTEDDEKLLEARRKKARESAGGDQEEEGSETVSATARKKSRREEELDEYSVWDEIDSYRMTFWFGSKLSRALSRSRKRDRTLEKELAELDRKREDEKKKKEIGES